MKSLFLSMIKDHMYSKRYAKSTIEAFLFWIAAYIRFNNMQHPSSMGDTQVELYLNHLVNSQNVPQGTKAQALNPLSFLYKEIINCPVSLSINFL
ncbi:site-specific integrase [Pseudoalteromonas sp. S1727]|uniref:site-specific integrase n=1 Tax=Pseudoalteromonas sp. S1727 TaxID=2066514 RepID=UPI0032D5772B